MSTVAPSRTQRAAPSVKHVPSFLRALGVTPAPARLSAAPTGAAPGRGGPGDPEPTPQSPALPASSLSGLFGLSDPGEPKAASSLVPLLIAALLLLGACSRDEAGPDGGAALLREARRAMGAGECLLAEERYIRYLERQPRGAERWEAWSRLAEIAAGGRGDPGRAVELLEAMRLEYGDDRDRLWRVLGDLGEQHARLGHWPEAADVLAKRLEFAERSLDERWTAGLELIRARQAAKSFDLALDAAERCRREAPAGLQAECGLETARTFVLMKRQDKAEPLLEELAADAAAPARTRAAAGMLLSEVCRQRGDKAKAKAALVLIADLHPNPGAVRARLKALENEK